MQTNNVTQRWNKDEHRLVAPRKSISFENQRDEFTWSKKPKDYSEEILIHRLCWNNWKNISVSLIIWAQHPWSPQIYELDVTTFRTVAWWFLFMCKFCKDCQGCSSIFWLWPTTKKLFSAAVLAQVRWSSSAKKWVPRVKKKAAGHCWRT